MEFPLPLLTLGKFRCVQSCYPKDTPTPPPKIALCLPNLHSNNFIKFIYLSPSNPFSVSPNRRKATNWTFFFYLTLPLSSSPFSVTMETMTKQQPFTPTSACTRLSMHKGSHVVSKFKPKIRIIHVFAPEIIKTDAANFRQLVQSLTGKPSEKNGIRRKIKTSSSSPGNKNPISKKVTDQQLQQNDGFPSGLRNESELIKEGIQELWRSSGEKINSFLDGFSDLDGFIEELSEFHSLPALRSSNYSRLDVLEDPKLV